MAAAGIEHVDTLLVDVNPRDGEPRSGEGHRQGQPHVAQANNGNVCPARANFLE